MNIQPHETVNSSFALNRSVLICCCFHPKLKDVQIKWLSMLPYPHLPQVMGNLLSYVSTNPGLTLESSLCLANLCLILFYTCCSYSFIWSQMEHVQSFIWTNRYLDIIPSPLRHPSFCPPILCPSPAQSFLHTEISNLNIKLTLPTKYFLIRASHNDYFCYFA